MQSNNESGVNNLNVKTINSWIELRFLISSKTAGLIIGQAGESIMNLRRSYTARINISENIGPERILSLEADLDTILEILRHAFGKIELSVSGSGDNAEIPNQVDLRMLVNHCLVGALIGRGGGRINELRERHDLRVLKVYQSLCPGSTDRVVQMIGTVSPITDCIRKVVDICKETPIREPKTNYDAQNFDPTISDNYGGWSSGPSRLEPFIIKGNSVGFSRPGFSNQQYGPVKTNLYDYSYNRESENSVGNFGYDDQNSIENKDCQLTLCLSRKMIGAVIGPGGCRIQQIRSDSEADITISTADIHSQERTVSICGTLSKVRRAQNMINEYIAKYGQ